MPKNRAEIYALIELTRLEAELRLERLDTLATIDTAEPDTLTAIAAIEAQIIAERAKPTGNGTPRKPRPPKP